MSADGKTEKASPKKRRDERKKGNIFFSKDIITIVSIIGIFYGLKFLFPFIYRTLREVFITSISNAGTTDITTSMLPELMNNGMVVLAKLIIPVTLLATVCAVVATGVQTKFIFTGKNFVPQFNRLNPMKGIQNMFALKNLIELLKSLIKITILFYLLYASIKGELYSITRTMHMDISTSAVYVLETIMKLIFKVVLVFVAISLFDYMYQWWEYERKIKMSKQEVKEEYKQTEGNPAIKGKIKEIQRERSRGRMMQAVPEADVIIRNPTHFAVALKYDQNKSHAPILVAKGQDELALRIVKVGTEHEVYILENKPLARAIYATTEIGQEIPQEYYAAVAEILVYVYQLNKKSVT